MSYTQRMHDALRRDTEGKQHVVTDLLDEIDRLTAELAEATDTIRLIAGHPVGNPLEAAAMKQLAINYLQAKGHSTHTEEVKE